MTLLRDPFAQDGRLKGLDLIRALRFNGVREGASGRYSVKVSSDGVYSYSFPIAVYKVSKQGVNIDDVIEAH